MGCRQPEKILLTPEFTVFPAELSQFNPLVAGELTLLRRTEITTVDAGLTDPLGQAAVGESQPLRNSRAAEPLTEAKSNGLLAEGFCEVFYPASRVGLRDAVDQLRRAQRWLTRYLAIYNGRRYHMAIGGRTPFQQLNRLRVAG